MVSTFGKAAEIAITAGGPGNPPASYSAREGDYRAQSTERVQKEGRKAGRAAPSEDPSGVYFICGSWLAGFWVVVLWDCYGLAGCSRGDVLSLLFWLPLHAPEIHSDGLL